MNSDTQVGASASTQSRVASLQSAGPLRRLGAVLYDTLLVIAIVVSVILAFVLLNRGRGITTADGWLLYLFRVTLLVAAASFFIYFWTARGRTLGMQAWGLRVERMDSSLPTLRDALLRLSLAGLLWLPGVLVLMLAVQPGSSKTLLSLGGYLFLLVPINYLSAWLDPLRRSWHDRFLQTRIKRVA